MAGQCTVGRLHSRHALAHHRPGILPVFRNRLLTEIQAEDLRALCNKFKERGAPATAVYIRNIVKQVYVYAIAHGEKVENPSESVRAFSIATFVPKDRALSPLEIRLVIQHLESVATYPTITLALRLILLTLVQEQTDPGPLG